MATVCADGGVGVVIMHMPGDPRTMQDNPAYDDVVVEVRNYLASRIESARAAGIEIDRIAIDPGIGFGKNLNHNLSLLDAVCALGELNRPVLVGTSRKSFLGTLTGRGSDDRDVVSAVSAGIAILGGASIIRAHNVPFTADAVALSDAMVKSRDAGGIDGNGNWTETP